MTSYKSLTQSLNTIKLTTPTIHLKTLNPNSLVVSILHLTSNFNLPVSWLLVILDSWEEDSALTTKLLLLEYCLKVWNLMDLRKAHWESEEGGEEEDTEEGWLNTMEEAITK